jgi:hypothetical protein
MKNTKSNFGLLVLAIGVVAIWRGVWGLMDLYLFPDNPTLSFIISIAVGLFILYFNDRKLNELVQGN